MLLSDSRSFTLLLFVLLVGCAKVGDPLPPLVFTPETVSGFEVIQEGSDKIFAVFPLPPTPFEEVEVLRSCDAEDLPPEVVVKSKATSLPIHADESKRILADPFPLRDRPCTYSVQFRNRQGRRSPPSNRVTTRLISVPRPPVNLQATVLQDEVKIRWEGPVETAAVLGFLVNSRQFVKNREFSLRNFEFGQPLSVQVQSVARLSNPLVLSAPSTTLTLVPRDIFAPDPPRNLNVVRVEGGAQLVWDPSPADDLASYNIYRRVPRDGDFQLIASKLSVNRYLDSFDVMPKLTYYVVTAVDLWGNESAHSEQVGLSDEQ